MDYKEVEKEMRESPAHSTPSFKSEILIKLYTSDNNDLNIQLKANFEVDCIFEILLIASQPTH